MLEQLARDVKAGTPEARRQALNRVYHLALLALALPGLPLGLLYRVTRPATFSWPITLALVLLAVFFAAYVLWRNRSVPADQPLAERLTSAMQLAAAPGIPFLLGCAAFHDLKTWWSCWLVALLAYALARRLVSTLV